MSIEKIRWIISLDHFSLITIQPEILKYTIDKLVHYVQDCKYNHFWFTEA